MPTSGYKYKFGHSCCCCTAESQANLGRHQLYNNQKNCPTCAFSTAWLMQLTTTFFVFRPQAQGYSLPDLSTSTPDEILDYIRRHYVLIKTSDGYILGRNTRKRARYLTAQSWEEFDKAKGQVGVALIQCFSSLTPISIECPSRSRTSVRLTLIVLIHPLPFSAWADGNLAELPGQGARWYMYQSQPHQGPSPAATPCITICANTDAARA